MATIKVIKFLPNPTTEDHSVTFKKSTTGTRYFKFDAIYEDNPIILFLSLYYVNKYVGGASSMENRTISVDDTDLKVALQNNSGASGTIVMVFFVFEVVKPLTKTETHIQALNIINHPDAKIDTTFAPYMITIHIGTMQTSIMGSYYRALKALDDCEHIGFKTIDLSKVPPQEPNDMEGQIVGA